MDKFGDLREKVPYGPISDRLGRRGALEINVLEIRVYQNGFCPRKVLFIQTRTAFDETENWRI